MTHGEQAQAIPGQGDECERVCAEAQDNHSQDELDDPEGDEALRVVGDVFAACWPIARVITGIHVGWQLRDRDE